MNFTDEQNEIIQHTPRHGEIIKVAAYAGTGKSTTLKGFAEARPGTKHLYVVFNKSMQLEAQAKFPPHVECRTAHSLAFREFGSHYMKRNQVTFNWRPKLIAKQLHTEVMDAKYVVDTVNNFLQSADREIGSQHIPEKYIKWVRSRVDPKADDSDNTVRLYCENILSLSAIFFEKCKDLRQKDFHITHDFYLKLWQLSGPHLHYDVIMLDEAQDTTPCVLDVLQRQTHAVRILVGDEHQAIYSWRGAIDAMTNMDHDTQFVLSNSFRMNQESADLASKILRIFKDQDVSIQGMGRSEDQTFAMLARTNSALFAEAIERQDDLIHWVGGLKQYPFDPALDVLNLMEGNRGKIKDPFLLMFPNLDALTKYAAEVEDLDMMSKISLCKRYEQRLPILLNDLYAREANERNADLTFTTAHKSKGLEWDNVELIPGYSETKFGQRVVDEMKDEFDPKHFARQINLDNLIDDEELNPNHETQGHSDLNQRNMAYEFIGHIEDKWGHLVSPLTYKREEANLLYVAVSRAKGNAILPKDAEIIGRNDVKSPTKQDVKDLKRFISKFGAANLTDGLTTRLKSMAAYPTDQLAN